MIEPTIWSSLHCSSYPCDYCEECSHAYFLGWATADNGKTYRWHFNPYHGYEFLKSDFYTQLKNQYFKEDHIVWKLIETWEDKRNYKHMWQ